MKGKFKVVLILALALSLASCKGGDKVADKTGSTIPAPTETIELPKEDDLVHLFILTGQSGARGKALNSDLSNDEKIPNANVDILADGLMMGALHNIPDDINQSLSLDAVKPGFGDTKSEFGPELGMAETLESRFLKNGKAHKSVIIKYTACGSTFKEHWYSKSLVEDDNYSEKLDILQIREDKNGNATGPLTNNLYKLIDKAKELLEAEGFETVIDGAAFIHGEQDAKYEENMEIYPKALDYFINDLREYVGNPNMPFVITEALTNSADYSNDLRKIQREAAARISNCTLIENDSLYTNSFEPWHFNKDSNYLIGNKIAAELIYKNDTREVSEITNDVIDVAYNGVTKLPSYIKAKFTNGEEGYIKASSISNYDGAREGIQYVAFKSWLKNGEYLGSLKVNVTKNPIVDGILDDEFYKTSIAHDVFMFAKLYIKKAEDGLYIGAKIDDKSIYTAGEAWARDDMGQNGKNDDFRIYIATGNNKHEIALSAANLLRAYTNSKIENAKPNLNNIYNKSFSNYKYKVVTSGICNKNDMANGFTLELYLSYSDLDVANSDDIKLLFAYSDIKRNSNGELSNTISYFGKKEGSNLEASLDSYFSINELF